MDTTSGCVSETASINIRILEKTEAKFGKR